MGLEYASEAKIYMKTCKFDDAGFIAASSNIPSRDWEIWPLSHLKHISVDFS